MRICYPALALGLVVGLTPSGSAQGPDKGNPKSLDRGRAFAEAGRVDLFVASSAAWGLPADDDRNWDPALKLGVALARGGKLEEWPPDSCPKAFLSMDGYRATIKKPQFRKQDIHYRPPDKFANGTPRYYWPEAILAPGVSFPLGAGYNIVLSRGPVKTGSSLSQALVFATGDVTVGDHVSHAIVVCDGDVLVESHITSSALVVARGKIHAKGTTDRSVLVAGGKVTIEKPTRANPEFHSKVTEDEMNPFGFVRFFELSRVGVKVSAADKAVRISDVADAKAFAFAGAVKGDVVEAVNGAKPESEESLRRLLRDALAVGDATVRVRRGDKVETLKVTLPAE